MRRPDRAAVGLVLLWCLAGPAAAVCVDWKRMGRFALVDAASVVFEGTLERVEIADPHECAEDRLVFRADRVWKGTPTAEVSIWAYTGRAIHGRPGDGFIARSCGASAEDDSFDVGSRYIVFASGPSGQLRSMGCSSSAAPTRDTERTLEAWCKAKGGCPRRTDEK